MHDKTRRLLKTARITLSRGGWTSDGRVPSSRELASRWIVSKELANKIIRTLADEGLLEKDPTGYRYYLAGKAPQPVRKVRSKAGSSPEWVAGRLRDAILDGSYSVALPLPSLRDCMATWRCSYATASRAYAILDEEGLAERRGRRWHIRLLKTASEGAGARVFLIDNSQRPFSHRQNGIIHGIEHALARWQWPGLRRAFIGDPLPPSTGIAGIIVTHRHIHGKRWKPPGRVPCVYIDSSGEPVRPPAWPSRYYRLIPDHFAAGTALGQLLGSKGHSRVAFVTHHSLRSNWVMQRLEGARKGLRITAGPSSEVHVVDFSHQSQEKTPIHPRSNMRATARAALGMHSNEWMSLLGHEVSTRVFVQFGESFLRSLATARHIAPQITEVARSLEVSAWICANDYMALTVKSALESSPPLVSPPVVAGFDNSPEAQIAGITSYDFGWDRVGFRAVECIVRPESSAGTKPNSDIRITGRVIERQSTLG